MYEPVSVKTGLNEAFSKHFLKFEIFQIYGLSNHLGSTVFKTSKTSYLCFAVTVFGARKK